ncbi:MULTISPECIES: phosphoglucosamine mutase [Candidatus Nitrosocaldus]|jgi:phosphomannomutase/phosphoglucomutase|uniref:Phosphoglucosamine mutase n=1 Tax=Candidatus Nitrosocaldus cavascurensis TaxID=2058097 RepID=A0A2K5AQ27_9ARCH|nr:MULTISPECIES: phosphoglucosamine mutase [Candidatus Nitrosocaldus]SPC33756.1 Phosphoglucosamine mutase [Candidatus Nitrosocaldus cavascurensis]
MARLFGTNGVRGVFGKDLTLDLVLKLSYALATYYREGPLLLAYDGRHSSPLIASVVKAGLNAMGIDVHDAGLVPTPCLQYCTKRLGYRGGIMITASHNPPEYNGIKVMASDGVEVPREDELKIEDIYFEERFMQSKGIGRDERLGDAVDLYLQGIRSLVDVDRIRSKGMKVVVDLGNGAQAVAVPRLLNSLGCKVVTLNGMIDGSFPGRGSEPTIDNLGELASSVKANGADLGIAYDGDGDRSIFCDEQGNIYTGDRSGALLVEHVLAKEGEGQRGKVKVVTPVNSSMLIDMVAASYNAKVIKTKVGSVEVSREMVRASALVGLEENGGFMYARHIPVRDGAMSTALMLEALALRDEPLSSLIGRYKRFYQYKTKFPCTREQSSSIIDALKGTSSRVETIDGIKVWVDDESWIMVRQSGTEPIMRLYAESSSEQRLKQMVDVYVEKIRSLLGSK